MSLDTLLEAARYLEMQEQKQRQTASAPPKYTSPSQATTPPTSSQQPRPSSTPNNNNVPGKVSPQIDDSLVTVISHWQNQNNSQQTPQRVIRNSFDLINPLVIDEAGEMKRKPPPMVFRSGTREVHNKLEKCRRAHLKDCFEVLKQQLPASSDEKKTSNLTILHSAIKCIQSLKKEEREFEHEMERLAREKIALQQKLAILKKDGSVHSEADFSALLSDSSQPEKPPSPRSETITLDIKPTMVTTARATTVTASTLPIVTAATLNGVQQQSVVGGQQQHQQQQVQTTALSVLPLGYQMNQGLVVQKVLVPKGITDLSQLVSAGGPQVAHFIAAPQQIGGKVVPLVNQYLMKPLVVAVSTPSRPS